MTVNSTTVASGILSVVLALTTLYQEHRVNQKETAKVEVSDSCSVALSHVMKENYKKQQRNDELVDQLLQCVSE